MFCQKLPKNLSRKSHYSPLTTHYHLETIRLIKAKTMVKMCLVPSIQVFSLVLDILQTN